MSKLLMASNHRATFLFNDIIDTGFIVTREVVEKHCITVPELYRISWDFLKRLSVLTKEELRDYIRFEFQREREIYNAR